MGTPTAATVLASFSPISGVNGLRRLLSGRRRRRRRRRQTVKCAPLMSVRCVANAADRFVHSVGFAPEKLGCYAEKTHESQSHRAATKSAPIPSWHPRFLLGDTHRSWSCQGGADSEIVKVNKTNRYEFSASRFLQCIFGISVDTL